MIALAAAVAGGVLLVALPAGATITAANRGPDLSGVTLRVGYTVVRDTSSQDIRIASGAFDNTPYAIKWASFPSSTATVEALNAGAIDVTPDTQATAVLLAQGGAKTPWTRKSAPIKAVGASAAGNAAGSSIVVRPGSGIRTVKDLAGKKVTYVRGGPSQLYWAVTARKAKLPKGSYQPVELAVADGRAAFLSGAVDALVGSTRTVGPLVQAGQAEVIDRANPQQRYDIRLTMSRPSFLDDKANRAAVADFVARLHRSRQWVLKHPDDTMAIYQRVAKVTADDAKAAYDELPTKQLALDPSLRDALQNEAGIFYDYGVTPTKPKVAVLFDPRFVPKTETGQ